MSKKKQAVIKRCPVCKEETTSKGVTCGKRCGLILQRRKCAKWWKLNKADFSLKLREKKRFPQLTLAL